MSRHPAWARVAVREGRTSGLGALLAREGATTVCEEAGCPNLPDCWARGTATLMLLGKRCTRGCRYCAVGHGRPSAPDPAEPASVALSVSRAGWKYVVLTMVDRDDLPDGGARHVAEVVRAVKALPSAPLVEALVGDFGGDLSAVDRVLDAGVDVLAHNVETVSRLYPLLRPQGSYGRALDLLAHAGARGWRTKTSLIAGMGERFAEVREMLGDLAQRGVWAFTAGQYLRPSPAQMAVVTHRSPAWFSRLEEAARSLGLRAVCGPLVRSSYRAEALFSGSGGS